MTGRRPLTDSCAFRGGDPTHEEIALRAYQIHLEHGGAHGKDMEDWLQAERELREEMQRSNAAERASPARKPIMPPL